MDEAGGTAEPPRVRIDLDHGWRFFAGDDPRAAAPGFDDSAWTAVDLPHTWNALDGEDGGGYRRGAGWYRRHLRVAAPLAGRRLYLQFDGASLMADVYVNGRHLGTHRGGFARFRFDATDALRPGEDNVIAVRVDNGALGIAPTRADFTFFGGIYRGVSLLATDPLQITAMDYGSPGVYVTQRRVTPAEADLEVLAKLDNHAGASRDATVRISVIDAGGTVVAADTAPCRIASGGSAEVRRPLVLAHPHLWNGRADPYLYTVRVEVEAPPPGGGPAVVRDAVVQPLGVRFFRVDPDQGFFLNGRHLDLHGVNRHQDRIDRGWAITPEDEAEDFALIYELGCTFMRTSHYQQAETWYQRCDRGGIVVWTEIPYVDHAGPMPAFRDNAERQLRELIRQNYNHPSICFWSIGNEVRDAASDAILPLLAREARAEDPTRLSTYASDAPENSPKNWNTDVVAFNRYYGWYHGEPPEFAREIDAIHAGHPHAAIGISEFGAGASIFQHEEDPPRPDPKGRFHPEEYQDKFHEAYWAMLEARPYLWCKTIWCMYDFASDSRREGDHAGRNDKGLVTYDRKIRKDAYYFYQANWRSDVPVLHLVDRRFTDRREPVTEIKVYSNASAVTVSLNGVSLGARTAPDHVFLWPQARLAPGGNQVVATARFGDQELTDRCAWTYRPGP